MFRNKFKIKIISSSGLEKYLSDILEIEYPEQFFNQINKNFILKVVYDESEDSKKQFEFIKNLLEKNDELIIKIEILDKKDFPTLEHTYNNCKIEKISDFEYYDKYLFYSIKINYDDFLIKKNDNLS